MKVLLDSCVWGPALHVLVAAGHDVVWAGDWSVDPGDREILARAHNENRVLVTLDKDFGELAIVQLQPHSGIIRLVDTIVPTSTAITISSASISPPSPSRGSARCP